MLRWHSNNNTLLTSSAAGAAWHTRASLTNTFICDSATACSSRRRATFSPDRSCSAISTADRHTCLYSSLLNSELDRLASLIRLDCQLLEVSPAFPTAISICRNCADSS